MAPASCSTEIAHPRSVRIAGGRSVAISIETLLARDTNPLGPPAIPLLTQGRDPELWEIWLFHLFHGSSAQRR
jgi:hypothetical protein